MPSKNIEVWENELRLSRAELEVMTKGHCPDCNHRGFVLGPRGGASINIECGGCGNRFNVAAGIVTHDLVMGQRIPRGPAWRP